MRNWIKYYLVLPLGILLLSVASVAQNDSTQTEVRKKNGIYFSYGIRAYGFALNYERFIYASKKRPITVVPSIGLGVYDFTGSSITIPVSLDVGYGEKNRVSISIGHTSMINFNPNLETQEEIDRYMSDPSYYPYPGEQPTLPYQCMINSGLVYRLTLKYGIYIQTGGYVVLGRIPAWSDPDRKWRYVVKALNIELAAGIRF